MIFIAFVLIFNSQMQNKRKEMSLIETYERKEDFQKSKKQPKNIYVRSLQIKLKHIINVNLNGNVIIEDKKFHLIASSILGKEIDIGINENELWYWAKRSKPKGLYYSKLENINKTNLKSALNPNWIMTSFGLNFKKNDKSEMFPSGNSIIILNKDINHLGENNTIVTIIDKKTEIILGNYLYNNFGKLVASSEIKEYQKIKDYILPKIIFIMWQDEGISMEWTLNDIVVDLNVNDNAWNRPNIYPSINIGK